MSLKLVSPAVVEHVTGIWVKQLRNRLEDTDQRLWSCPTYPYQIVSVEQYSNRAVLEVFEARRNELDKRLGKMQKLETIDAFYCPSSQEVLNQIIKDGFHETFSGELTVCTDAPQAIQESFANHKVNKVIMLRASLGWKDADYTEINHKYKMKNLRSLIPSFVITFQQIGEPAIPNSPPPSSNYVELNLTVNQLNHIASSQSSSFSTPPTSPGSSNVSTPSSTGSARLPKYITDLDKSLE